MKLEIALLGMLVGIVCVNCGLVKYRPITSIVNDRFPVFDLIDQVPMHELEESLHHFVDKETHDVIKYDQQADDVSADEGDDAEKAKRSADASNPMLSNRISKYKQWRSMNGYGRMSGRWGRSPQLSSLATQLNNQDLTQEERVKKMRILLAVYKYWRQKNGYGRPAGRWGR